MTDHRKIHSAELQTGMHIHANRPACWTEEATVRAPGFWDDGRSCGAALTPAVWRVTLAHTPKCASCARARRSAEISAGLA